MARFIDSLRDLPRAPKAMGPLGDLVRSPKAIVQWLIRTFATDALLRLGSVW